MPENINWFLMGALNSGVYFYSMTAGAFKQTQKALLILFGFNSPTLASFTIDNTPLDTPTLASGSFIEMSARIALF